MVSAVCCPLEPEGCLKSFSACAWPVVACAVSTLAAVAFVSSLSVSTACGSLARHKPQLQGRTTNLTRPAASGWPWDAIGVMSRINKQRLMLPAGNPVNLYYGWDVLNDGDIRRHRQPESHTPFVCYVMGEADYFGVSKTRKVYDHWRGTGAENRFPSETPDVRKWFWTLPQVVHPGTPGPQVWEWPGYGRLQQEFFERVLTGGIAG